MFYNEQKKQVSIKIGDLGNSKQTESENEYLRSYVGTKFYQSPEQWYREAYTAKTDVWYFEFFFYLAEKKLERGVFSLAH